MVYATTTSRSVYIYRRKKRKREIDPWSLIANMFNLIYPIDSIHSLSLGRTKSLWTLRV